MSALHRPVLVAMLACAACHVPASPAGDVIVNAPGLYPEGVAFDPTTGGFFVSSLRDGTVGRVSRDGTVRPFVPSGPLVSTQGIAVDAVRGRLLVVGGDLGVGARSSDASERRQAGLAVYSLASGALQAYVVLDGLAPGPHHANDVALAADGTAYVTDSFAGVIYRVAPDGAASVLARDAAWTAGENVALNGIAVHPDGLLLVAQSAEGALYRVDLADPARIKRVALSEALVGADGLALLDARTLVVVQNEGADRTLRLESADGWRSARVTGEAASALPFPTTAALAPDGLFVLNAQLDALFSPDGSPPARALIQRVTFGDAPGR